MKKIIKNLGFLLIAVLIVFSSCNKEDKDDGPSNTTIVSKTPAPRNVVLEEFTGINCQFCPDGAVKAKAIYDANPGRVVLIAVHAAGSYSIPSSGQPDFRTQWGDGIVGLGQPSGYPNGMVNRELYTGTKLSMGRGSWASAADVILNDGNSPVNIGMKSTWNSNSRELTIDVELFYTATTGPQLLNIVFLESKVLGYQSGAANSPNYEHNHILRDMITGQWGEEITSTNKDDSFKKTYTYIVDNTWIIENCDLAAFITQADHEKIFTGVGMKAKNGAIGN